MKSWVIAGIGVALATVAGWQPAAAETITRWDQAEQRYITYDMDALRVVSDRSGSSSSSIGREVVDYDGPEGMDTVVIDTSERRLYYVFEEGKAWKYGVGVGREGFQWAGRNRISRKAEWPGWTPPPQMIARERAKGVVLPAYMEGGPNNPLGARALYIGSTLYRIHGSNQPWTIGQAVSSGCIRMVNDDVIHLYDMVSVGTRVVVKR